MKKYKKACLWPDPISRHPIFGFRSRLNKKPQTQKLEKFKHKNEREEAEREREGERERDD
jgi:hypothetical protein